MTDLTLVPATAADFDHRSFDKREVAGLHAKTLRLVADDEQTTSPTRAGHLRLLAAIVAPASSAA